MFGAPSPYTLSRSALNKNNTAELVDIVSSYENKTFLQRLLHTINPFDWTNIEYLAARDIISDRTTYSAPVR